MGSAYVFVRSGTTWTQQAKLTPSETTGLTYILAGGFLELVPRVLQLPE